MFTLPFKLPSSDVKLVETWINCNNDADDLGLEIWYSFQEGAGTFSIQKDGKDICRTASLLFLSGFMEGYLASQDLDKCLKRHGILKEGVKNESV